MKIKLHNKYEITMGDKTYVAYNTLTNKIFDAIGGFVSYGSYLSVGNGTQELGYETPKLSSQIINLKTTLEEIQCDPSKGTMFVKRTVHVHDTEDRFAITEFGLTDEDSTQYNSVVYSHAYIRDEFGNIMSIYKTPDVDLFIRVTIYLEFDDETKTMLTAGENLLVKAILGELGYTPKVSVCRGFNNTPNGNFVLRNMPNGAIKYETKYKHFTDQNIEKLQYEFDLRSGETAELVLLFDDIPVARINTVEQGTKVEFVLDDVKSQSNYTLDLGENIFEINQVNDVIQTEVTNYKSRKYAKDFTDFIANPFEASLTSDCARWVSADGDKLAFVVDDTVYVYKNQNYALYKINHNIPSTNLKKIIMFEDYIFAVYSQGVCLRVYTINENFTATEVGVDLESYKTLDTTFEWQDVQIINDNSNNFVIGMVLGAISRRPVIAKATFVDNLFKITQANYGKSDYIVNTFALYKNNFCDSMIGFVTNNYNNTVENYRIEQWNADYTCEVTNEIPAYYLCNGTVSIEGKSRAVIAKMTQAPYVWIYYYPQVYRYNISLADGVKNWISTNLMYIIQKYENSDVPYKIYSLNDYDNPQEFLNGFPSSIDSSTITDFEFLNDTLIIFTTSQTYALNLKVNQTVLENMPEAGASYTVKGRKVELLGTDKKQGIMGSFTIGFRV